MLGACRYCAYMHRHLFWFYCTPPGGHSLQFSSHKTHCDLGQHLVLTHLKALVQLEAVEHKLRTNKSVTGQEIERINFDGTACTTSIHKMRKTLRERKRKAPLSAASNCIILFSYIESLQWGEQEVLSTFFNTGSSLSVATYVGNEQMK